MSSYQKSLFACLLFTICMGCQQKSEWTNEWRFVVLANEKEIPFNVRLYQNNDAWKADFRNGEEVLTMDEVFVEDDSFQISMGIFDAALYGRKKGDQLIGTYHRAFEGDYYLPLTASVSKERFTIQKEDKAVDFSGKWAVTFTEEDGASYPAIGQFEQQGKKLTGTFMTETGDYRFLEGNVSGNVMKLSVFDGSHVFLFEAELNDSNQLSGGFWSGKHYYASWKAVKDKTVELQDADSLTYLKPGYEKLAFSFPDTLGNEVSLTDYIGQPMIIQLLGTWCPNCMDETLFLTNWQNEHPESPVQILGLAYEYKNTIYATERVKKLTQKLDVSYPILVAGSENKDAASLTLPMLNQITSFPTTIFLNAQHQIVRIHTGFSGPGTGKVYDEFVKTFDQTISEITSSD